MTLNRVSGSRRLQLWLVDRFARCWGQVYGEGWVALPKEPREWLGVYPYVGQLRISRRFCRLIDRIGRKPPGTTRAITLATTVIVAGELELDRALIVHEKRHIRQWVEHGPWGFIRHFHRFEEEAEAAELEA